MLANGSETHGTCRTQVDRDNFYTVLDFWCILWYIHKMEQKIIKGEHLTSKPKVYNEEAFSSYTPESAYWAGFIAADGCITGGTLKICLNYKDINHLEKFKAYVDSTHKISFNTDKYYRAEIGFKNNKISEALELNYNITPNKSLIYEMPILPDEVVWDFIRGYFDGDGCICESFSNKNSKTATLYTTIVGSKILIPELYDIIGLKGSIQEKATTKTIKYCSNSSYSLLSKLYDNAGTYLDRKYEYYQQIKQNGIKVR